MYHEQLQIENDTVNRVVRVGNWIANFSLGSKPKPEKDITLKLDVLYENNIHIEVENCQKTGHKHVHEEISSYLGVGFNRRLSAAMWAVYVEPIKDYCNEYCFYSNGSRHFYDTAQVLRLWEYKKLIDQIVIDKISNIAPLIIYFGCDPKQLKLQLGKGLWNRLSHNSKHKNKLFVKTLSRIYHDDKRIITFNFDTNRINIINKISFFKSSLLKYLALYNTFYLDSEGIHKDDINLFVDDMAWLSNNAPVSRYDICSFSYVTYRDTRKMAKQLDRNFNPNWSLKRINKEHKLSTKILMHKEFSTDIFKNILSISDMHNNGVHWRLLRSPSEISLEGLEMGHCVAAYIDNVVSGRYLVFSLKNDNDERSTLGVCINLGECFIDQHQARFDKGVTDKKLINAANLILDSVKQSIK